LLEVASYDTQTCYNSPFCKPKHLHRGWQQWELKAYMDPCFTFISGCLISVFKEQRPYWEGIGSSVSQNVGNHL
jgi:hypothetical protein